MTDIVAKAESFADRYEKLTDEAEQFATELAPHIKSWEVFIRDFNKRYIEDTQMTFPWVASPFRSYPTSQSNWDEVISWENYDGSNITFAGRDYDNEPVSWELPLNFVDDPEGYKAKAEVEWREGAAKYFEKLNRLVLEKKQQEIIKLQKQIEELKG